MSNRAAWLEEWCPDCWASPDARCRERYSARRHPRPSARLHVARGWRTRGCPTCKALPGQACRSPSGRESARPHAARQRPGRHELLTRQHIWDELDRRGATIAVAPFSGRAGRGGNVGTIVLSRVAGGELIDVERWTSRDELAYALEGPVWDRYGTFAGQPWIRASVIWTVEDRRVVIEGECGGIAFEEDVSWR